MSISQTYQDMVAAGDLTADPAQVAVLPEFDRIATRLLIPQKSSWFSKAPEAPKGLYLWGGVGRGKSMLMDMFARQVGDGVRRVHFHAFMQEVHAGMEAARKQGVDDAVLPVADQLSSGLKCLAFDEMQINDITDAMIVGRLFEALFERGVTIIATSNRTPDDLYKDGLNRALFLPFIELLKDRMVVWELSSPTDYRQGRLAGSNVYFSPLGDAATAAMDKVWKDLAGGDGGPLKLAVKGRKVVLPKFRNAVARASFQHLCGSPLGPADFLTIAENCKILLLDDVPILTPEKNNEAKRFVTLVDALYEAKVQLVISAADEPENLYPKGKGSFEFERTASRLREMQAESWTAG